MTDTVAKVYRGRKRSRAEAEREENECLRLKLLGWRDLDIAESMSISPATVQRRLRTGLARTKPLRVAEYREQVKQQLEVLERVAMSKVVDVETQNVNLEAATLVLRILERKSRLLGVDAPVKAEVEVTQVTEQERELRDLLAAAAAQQAAAEQVIVDGEVVS